MTTIDTVVEAYVECGKRAGYFFAECILMKYLPDGKPDGKCSDVPEGKRSAFLLDLENAAKYGVILKGGSICILNEKSTQSREE